jgi:hypothetical protein
VKRNLRIVLKSLALLIAATFVSGLIYEQFERRQDRKRIPQTGRSVDVGGRSLNIYCSGAGAPAVILESASGIGLEWGPIQTEVAKFTEACWHALFGQLGGVEPCCLFLNAACGMHAHNRHVTAVLPRNPWAGGDRLPF